MLDGCGEPVREGPGAGGRDFQDCSVRARGTVIGEEVQILSVSRGDNRRELTATCQRAGRQYDIAVLDIDIQADPSTSRRLAAYRRWLGV